MSALVKESVIAKKVLSKEEVKEALFVAIKQSFEDTKVATKDFTWFSSKELVR